MKSTYTAIIFQIEFEFQTHLKSKRIRINSDPIQANRFRFRLDFSSIRCIYIFFLILMNFKIFFSSLN